MASGDRCCGRSHGRGARGRRRSRLHDGRDRNRRRHCGGSRCPRRLSRRCRRSGLHGAGDGQRHRHLEALVAVGGDRQDGLQRVAGLTGNGRDEQLQEGGPAAEDRLPHLQPGLVAGGEGPRRPVLMRDHREGILQLFPGFTAELDLLLADLDVRRLGEPQRFQELLHRGDAGRGRAENRIGPAVRLVPTCQRTILKKRRGFFRRRHGFLRRLARTRVRPTARPRQTA